MAPDAPTSAMASATIWAGTNPAADDNALCRQFISKPMPAGIEFTTSTTFKGQVRCMESATNDNINRVAICLKVHDGSGGALKETLLVLGAYGVVAEWATSLKNKKIADGDTLAVNYTTELGDILVLEIGGQISSAAGGTSVTGTMSWGKDHASDLPENETTTTANNPWIEFSNTITFVSDNADCSKTFQSHLTPVIDMPGQLYLDPEGAVQLGGLYDTGLNTRPAAIDAVMPTVTEVSGVLGVALLGASTLRIIGDQVLPEVLRDPRKAAVVKFCNGCQGGIRTDEWANPDHTAWTDFAAALTAAGITASQLRVVFWMDYANAGTGTFEGEVEQVNIWTEAVVANVIAKYPSVQIVYLCAHHYVGYSAPALWDVYEPLGYWNVWSHKRVVAGRSGTATPWVVVGPYVWANGIAARLDRREYVCIDFEQTGGSSGIHLNPSGAKKATLDWMRFLHHDHSARWYRGE
jgi:hypothetical protein